MTQPQLFERPPRWCPCGHCRPVTCTECGVAYRMLGPGPFLCPDHPRCAGVLEEGS